MKNPIQFHTPTFALSLFAGLLLPAGPLHADTVLFLDTFNRANSTNLNAVADGKSGTLGALNWTGVTTLNGATTNILDINSNRLRSDPTGTNGNDGNLAWVDSNFIDASIKSAGAFTVSVDIPSGGSSGDGRHIGFGIGSSLTELGAVTLASPTANPSDVFFYYDNIGTTKGWRVVHNKVQQGTGLSPLPTGADTLPVTLSGKFTFADMNAGTTLNYEFFIDGVSVVTGSTTWSGTDENYICLQTNYTLASTFDNFKVSIPAPPTLVSTVPADDATGVAPDATLTATFDEPVFLNTTGSITIKNLTTTTDTVISLPGPDADGALSVTGNTLTIDPTAALGVPGDQIAIEISADAIKDADDTFYAGLLATDVPNWSFTIDNLPPVPAYFHPIPATAKAPLDGALFIGFGEDVLKGSGNLVIYKADNSVVETIDVASSNVTVNGSRVTIIPTVSLAYGTSYYVLVDSGAFTDALGNAYGLTDSSVWAFSTITNEATMLFGDSFNREDGNDLDASARGKYGSLGAVTYTKRSLGPGDVGNVELSSGQLLLESNENDGTAGALVYPNHNFIDPAIVSAGGFSITVDLNANLSGGTGRYLSVALGRAAADIDSQTSATVSGAAPTSDLVLGLRNNDTLWVYENGTHVTSPDGIANPPNTPTKMRIDCALTSFDDGSTVNYSVFFDDSVTAFHTGTFTWTGTGENYISLSSNLIVTVTPGERHALFDNLQIRTLGGGSQGFDTWKTTNNAVGQDLDGDHDGDGVSNGIEYFIGGPNGNTTGFTLLPAVVQSGGNRSVTFIKAGDYTGGYEVQVSPSLAAGSWSPATISPDPGIPGTVHISGNDVTYTFPAGTKHFVRLAVTGP